LQTPQLLTTDNEEAQIHVVTNKAFLTKSATGDQEYDAYEYKDVGSKLKITPQINQNRFVRLEIEQEYSTFSGTSEGDKPETFKRTAKTTVVVKDNHTVVIGGLVGEQISVGTAGVPCLGNIPLLGWLFKSYSRTRDKTNLFIFLTPHVLENPAEASDLYKEKRHTIDKLQEGVIKMYKKPPQQDTETAPDDNLSTEHNSNEP
ncbi:MAG: type II secretion system protein GspD, partial [Deltaproteobacteria bacterium]|nr:type II secretion system protein GspD [Deltaproteobacteria bacterium]